MRHTLQIGLLFALLTGVNIAACQESGTDTAPAPTWQWRCDGGETSFNFNPAKMADSSQSLVFDSIPYSGVYTLVAVYKPVTDTEAVIWKLDYSGGKTRGLTTEHIMSGDTRIRYADATAGTPIINTLRQTAPDSTAPFVRLTVGGDTLAGRVKVAEVMYFDRRLDNRMLRRVQSALAIRYGITLGPVDYVDGRGEVVWEYADSGLFHHRVTGVGRDSTYNILQTESRSEMEGSLLTIGTDSIPEGGFLVCGDDDAPLSFYSDGPIERLGRQWRIKCTRIGARPFSLTFDTRNFTSPADSVVLLADGHVCLPDITTAESVTYGNVMFPADTGVFTLARGAAFWQATASAGKGTQGGPCCDGEGVPVATQVYPNPTSGDYTIEVTGAAWVKVNIYDTRGRQMGSHDGTGQTRYLFKGNLPTGNSYYATVSTENGIQTMKLIVK